MFTIRIRCWPDTSVALRGRTSTTRDSGGGIPILPYQFTVGANVSERYRKFSGTLSFLFGQYESDNLYAYDLSLGIRLQYKFTRRYRMWLKMSGQRDINDSGVLTYGGSGTLGARVTF